MQMLNRLAGMDSAVCATSDSLGNGRASQQMFQFRPSASSVTAPLMTGSGFRILNRAPIGTLETVGRLI
jgi:hypothetical protein